MEISIANLFTKHQSNGREFDYGLNYKQLNFRNVPKLYRVGRGEQGVLLVEPYKSELLPHWRFKTCSEAQLSAASIFKKFRAYRRERDFVGMDMARKFLQMGFTRARRYANHRSGRKYDSRGMVLPKVKDFIKARSAQIFYLYWKDIEADRIYAKMKAEWRELFG